jgi:ABC-2 type transport system ATP-binding protein
MQRRIGLAQALINDPDLVILDEPTSGLDPIGCREVKDLILALAQRGKTIILSSHLLADVEDVCDRVVIYYGGKIQAMGTLRDLLATPDQLRITLPLLPRPTLERVLEAVRQDVAAEKLRVDTPTQNLESYFLGVVQKARQTEAETSGATSGNKVAAYLRGQADSPSTQADRILERLTSPTSSAPGTLRTAEPVAADRVDHGKLAGLTKTDGASSPDQAPAAPEKKADLEKANEKLASLLGKPK